MPVPFKNPTLNVEKHEMVALIPESLEEYNALFIYKALKSHGIDGGRRPLSVLSMVRSRGNSEVLRVVF